MCPSGAPGRARLSVVEPQLATAGPRDSWDSSRLGNLCRRDERWSRSVRRTRRLLHTGQNLWAVPASDFVHHLACHFVLVAVMEQKDVDTSAVAVPARRAISALAWT